MIKIINGIDEISTRNEEISGDIENTVKDIVADVISRGDAALLDYAKKFDGCDLTSIEVTKEEMKAAIDRLEPEFLETIKLAIKNIESFHKLQVQQGFKYEEEGIVLGQKITAIEKVGIYVPGGKAVYPSTVLMNVIPAKIAGCKQITVVSPPQKDGTISDGILACAYLTGVDNFYKIGGASAVAALAFGTETIDKVYKITGPGNAFVATAKRQVFGQVDIDMIAGPSEVLVIADDSCDPVIVAGDMLSQAEHDPMASSVLVTTSKNLAVAVQQELENQMNKLSRADICHKSIDDNSYIIVCNSLEECFNISNEIAPEHLEIMLDNPMDYLDKIQNAGSIFLGKHTPEPLGDYLAGVNHTLPTNGTAKFSSALGVDSFIKKSTFLCYDQKSLGNVKDHVARFAYKEGLDAHAQSVLNRYK